MRWYCQKGEMHMKLRFSTESTKTHGVKKLFHSVSDSEWNAQWEERALSRHKSQASKLSRISGEIGTVDGRHACDCEQGNDSSQSIMFSRNTEGEKCPMLVPGGDHGTNMV
ncbi:unnamed protein product [Cercospora beticola]|nr:unnamed protein product [Cercospora beticola]